MSAEILRAAAERCRSEEMAGRSSIDINLAVAKWLDDMAAGWKWDDPDELHLDFDDMPIRLDETTDSHALAVARAVLGGDE